MFGAAFWVPQEEVVEATKRLNGEWKDLVTVEKTKVGRCRLESA